MRRTALALSCLLLTLAGAAQAEPEGWANDLAEELMSPFCPGRTLSACPSPQAKTLVVWLGVQQAAGRSPDDVKAELVERFGEVILPAPPPRGFGLAAYAFPVLAFAVGGLLVWAFLRRQTHGASQLVEPLATDPLDPELEAIVDRDLVT
ncbi:MAG: cytochrome c-type biogenesis protein CcmH [Deltaproteobacteria bacterium]|nr:cytochrome c-type biogenesis protein CcmH [Deltaproteobacteria bacterium]MBW2361643.1 cytochrome c-type biogenesis protein CcmH [Deltaproteobacteria bacterium]